jgi:RimJ/RimL family protein N-acetyltransferase
MTSEPSSPNRPRDVQRLRVHDIQLSDANLLLRPMTEADWPVLLRWNNDPEVLYYAEGANVTSRTLEETQGIYRDVSQHAFNFIAELDGRPIGECWLQEMNLKRVLSRYPNTMDLRRIDLTMGEKTLWGQGYGTRIIRALVRFAFDECRADAVFGCDVADYNPRSRCAFEKNGFVVDQAIAQKPGRKAQVVFDMVLTRDRYSAALRESGR